MSPYGRGGAPRALRGASGPPGGGPSLPEKAASPFLPGAVRRLPVRASPAAVLGEPSPHGRWVRVRRGLAAGRAGRCSGRDGCAPPGAAGGRGRGGWAAGPGVPVGLSVSPV